VASVFDECTRQSFRRWRRSGAGGRVLPLCPDARPAPAAGDLHQVIQQVAQLYAGIRPGITLRTELDPAVPPLNLDPDQMKRALINLVDNAVAALGDDEGGSSSRRGTCPRPAEFCSRLPTPARFSPRGRDRAFLPYYSTKRSSAG